MAWHDRLKEAAYTSPSGKRVIFQYENVRKTFDKKTTAFNFPDANGTFIQDTGHTGRQYPLRLFFWGDNYDLEAQFFETLIQERGAGVLEHPVYGTVDVVPFGKVTQRDDLKTAANQAIIELAFWETTGLIYPTSQSSPGSDVLSSVTDWNDAAAGQFDDIADLDSAVEKSSFKNSFKALLDGAKTGLKSIAEAQKDVEKQFNAINDSINNGIDILIAQPLTLAFQTVLLIQAPGRALGNIRARLNAYSDLANSIISGDDAVISPGNDSRNSNEFQINDLYASAYVTGSIISVVNNEFATRSEALSAAEFILDQFTSVATWRDDNYQSLDQIDTGDAYQQLQNAVALTAGFLVEISFTLKQERRIVLDRSRTIIDLVAELYGSNVDDQLDFFINSNDLSGSEILELPKGREIVYYL